MIGALVPVKSLGRAKGRLAALLDEQERRRLSLAMLADVLRAVTAVPEVSVRAVVSADLEVLEAPKASGALGIEEPPAMRDLNSALTFAASHLMETGVDTLIVLPADIPSITRREVTDILEALPSPRGAIVVRSVARGTSALALRPPDAIPFRFGPQSALAHQQEAVRNKVPARVLRLPAIAIDIDEPQDLLDVLSRPGDSDTRRLLLDLDVRERLRSPTSRRRPA